MFDFSTARMHYARIEADILALLRKLVMIPSGSEQIDGVKAMQEALSEQFRSLGFRTRCQKVKSRAKALIAECGPEGSSPIVLLLHSDTVYTCNDPQVRESGDRLYGPGALDLKGAIASTIAAMQLIGDTANYSLRIVVNSSEEAPTEGVGEMIAALTKDARLVLGMEYGRENGDIVMARKGRAMLRLVAQGKSAHSGNNPQGIDNALVRMSRFIAQLPTIAERHNHVSIEPTAATAGDIRISNITPASAQCVLDVRGPHQKLEDARSEIFAAATLFGIELAEQRYTPGRANLDDSAETLYGLCKELSTALTMPCRKLELAGGLSDLNFVAPTIPAIDALGPSGDGAHNLEEEWVSKASVGDAALRLYAMLLSLK